MARRGLRISPVLEGKHIDLKLVDVDDLAPYAYWMQTWDFVGPFWPRRGSDCGRTS